MCSIAEIPFPMHTGIMRTTLKKPNGSDLDGKAEPL
jgi:hypothetical protein